MESNKKIAFLATGDELINGQTLNTNTPTMSQALVDLGMTVGNHAVATDEEKNIADLIHFLLSDHEALILVGGLGPTSDDRTRHALSAAVKKPLVFDAPTWDYIIQRLKSRGLTAPESNKQQAFFPEGATIIDNVNGTARGCYCSFNNKLIFMLPGPPRECLPMFHEVVIPILQKNNFAGPHYYKQWLLFGVSEGHLSDVLDQLPLPETCRLGYRIQYPYVELKVYAQSEPGFKKMVAEIEPRIEGKTINAQNIVASKLLLEFFEHFTGHLTIHDEATGGRLESTLSLPSNYKKISFGNKASDVFVHITGLHEFWSQQTSGVSFLEIAFNHEKPQRFEIPYHGRDNILLYAVELVCREIFLALAK